MMDKLAPPTDNLYKFIAIAGLILMLLGIVLVVRQADQVIDSQIAAVDATQEAWLAVGDSEEAKNLLNEYMRKASDGEGVFGLSEKANAIEELDEDALSAIRRVEIRGESFARSVQLNGAIQSYLGYMIGVSIVLMAIGFGYWYWKTQRLQDIILRNQAEEEAPGEVESGPANAYSKWDAEEDQKLRDGFNSDQSIKSLSKTHERTRGAIRSRLIKLCLIEDPRIK